jgi:thiol-disulfide isomerase/thioredoxin
MPYLHIQSRVDESGCGMLTLPDAGGEIQLASFDSMWRLVSGPPTKLYVPPGFRPDRVASIKRGESGDSLTIDDESGLRATLTGSDAAVVDGYLEIRFRASAPSEAESFAVRGRVVDESGTPIAEAIVALGSGAPQGGRSMTTNHSRTNEEGRFTISSLSKSAYGSDQQLLLMVRRDRYAGVDTDYKPICKDLSIESMDFGTITLRPGYEARLRVVDPEGKPLLGAWVEPGGNYAARAELQRSDANGLCTIRNLASGIQSVDVRFGDLYANAKLVVVPGDMEEELVRLKPTPTPRAVVDAEKQQQPLAAGEEMPEWDVVGWSDGVSRKLADYRGKVVVIDIWGVWCSACLNAIPGLQELQQRFRESDVVFLGIHTAGTDLGQIRKLMDFKQWNWPTGLDIGEDINSGSTVQRYRVRGFPSTIVVGRDGKVLFNTDSNTGDRDAVSKEMEQIARALNIPWPIPADMPEEDGVLLNRMLVHRLAVQIEAALQTE